MFDLVKTSVKQFIADDCPRKAAALAFYTILSLPPLLLILIAIAGVVWSEDAAAGTLQRQIEKFATPGAANAVGTMIDHANDPRAQTGLAVLFGIAGVLFGATGALAQLQKSLNDAWEIEPEASGAKQFIVKRALSLLFILLIGLLMFALVAGSAALAALRETIRDSITVPGINIVFEILNLILSVVLVTVLFAAVFKYLPDAKIEWKDVWVGAAVTAMLFVIGKFLIGWYLGASDKTAAYGAAGSLALLLIWIYYSALIFFLGAEFTQAWWKRQTGADRPEPSPGAKAKPGAHGAWDAAGTRGQGVRGQSL